jgi:hypothetical protein
MKKIASIFTILCLLVICQVQAQYAKAVVLTLSGSDTMTQSQTKDYGKVLTSPYYWALSVYHDKLSGSSDTVLYTLQESVDGTHYTAVVGAPTKKLGADGTYIWSGGTGTLPPVWSTGYLRLDAAYTSTVTATCRDYVKLQIKPIY